MISPQRSTETPSTELKVRSNRRSSGWKKLSLATTTVCLAWLSSTATTLHGQDAFNRYSTPSSSIANSYYNQNPSATAAPVQNYPQQTFTAPPATYTPPQAFDPYGSSGQTYTPPQSFGAPSNQGQSTYSAQPYTAQQIVAPNNGFVAPEAVQGIPFNAQPAIPAAQVPAVPVPSGLGEPLPPLSSPWAMSTDAANTGGLYQPRVRQVPIDVILQEAQTGRFILGGTVNTDLGVAGQVIVEERNFDITNFPRRPGDMFNGAFRGAGQNFRLEAVPGNQVQRYSVDWTEPNLFGYSPYSLSVGGFFFNRIYRDYDEERLGGRVAIGYVVTPDLQVSSEIRLENVEISDPRVNGVAILDNALGDSDVYTGRIRLTHNTRDSPFLPTEGHFFEAIYDQVFGEFDFPRVQLNFSRYYLVRQRADGGGRHTFTLSHRLGFSGEDTPIFENFFAGGFSTMRGFRFRGASPTENDVQVGGRMQYLGSAEYMFPLTADDMLRMVTFVDYGIIERDIDFNWDNFRVAPGIGLRVTVPAMGPAPLAFDFAAPLNKADGDQTQVFSFSVGLTR